MAKKLEFVADIVCTVKDGKIVGGEDGQPNDKLEQALNGIEYEVLNERGPAGGWPEIKFKGSKQSLKALLWLLFTGKTHDEFKALFDAWDGSQEGVLSIIG